MVTLDWYIFVLALAVAASFGAFVPALAGLVRARRQLEAAREDLIESMDRLGARTRELFAEAEELAVDWEPGQPAATAPASVHIERQA